MPAASIAVGGGGTVPAWQREPVLRHAIPKPVIAAVHRFAFGGGMEIVLASDLVKGEL
jgi:1,4-dihydroxy-2-naphthoyl-CoA synthase